MMELMMMTTQTLKDSDTKQTGESGEQWSHGILGQVSINFILVFVYYHLDDYHLDDHYHHLDDHYYHLEDHYYHLDDQERER